VDVISAEQYARMDSGEATYLDIRNEHLHAMFDRLNARAARWLADDTECGTFP
jgi:hypothetical protein